MICFTLFSMKKMLNVIFFSYQRRRPTNTAELRTRFFVKTEQKSVIKLAVCLTSKNIAIGKYIIWASP